MTDTPPYQCPDCLKGNCAGQMYPGHPPVVPRPGELTQPTSPAKSEVFRALAETPGTDLNHQDAMDLWLNTLNDHDGTPADDIQLHIEQVWNPELPFSGKITWIITGNAHRRTS